ncbi:uncharacterized protein LOC121838115 [Ixodes scapularis]|uniref:uncharacterized protein LOC121838115 n=1 Tax=Ixodes scapularis TaxID=6945 RepID=UPI001C382CA9|nr:uncharacterized protein LOC121838115 [Ixodes scapularis]
MLAMYVTHEHKNWDVALPYVTFAYNSSPHNTTVYSDLVLIWTPQRQVGLAQKLLPRYRGPFRILNRTSDVNYTVEPVEPPQNNRHRQVQTVHVLRLKPYITYSNGGTPFPPEGE